MTELELKINRIIHKIYYDLGQPGASDTAEYDATSRITKLVADTVLKAIGENQKLSPSLPFLNDTISAQNALRAEIKSNIFTALGIKEKV